MNDHLQYLALLAGCVLITLPLELMLRARVYRRPARWLRALTLTVVVFSVWDILGIVRRCWTYNPRYISGINLGPMPLEELLFFIVVPTCGLLTYEAVGFVLNRLRRRRTRGAAERA